MLLFYKGMSLTIIYDLNEKSYLKMEVAFNVLEHSKQHSSKISRCVDDLKVTPILS